MKGNAPHRAMTVTYEVDGGLYINVTNRCTNSCEFCIRKNGDGAYGSESLWLLREPDAEEITAEVMKRDIPSYREVVFCGYGEPTFRLDAVIAVAEAIKCAYPNTYIRINTNGHSDLINGRETAPLFEGVFDCVSISLNTPSVEKYVALCHPVYKEKAYFAMLDFAKSVRKYVGTVRLSVVRETLSTEELCRCQRIAEECGVELLVRTYISG